MRVRVGEDSGGGRGVGSNRVDANARPLSITYVSVLSVPEFPLVRLRVPSVVSVRHLLLLLQLLSERFFQTVAIAAAHMHRAKTDRGEGGEEGRRKESRRRKVREMSSYNGTGVDS